MIRLTVLSALLILPASARFAAAQQQPLPLTIAPPPQWLFAPKPSSPWHAESMGFPTSAARALPAPHSRRRTTLMAAGGVVLGAWAGYLTSQIVRSDWEKGSNGEFSQFRTKLAVGGGVIGAGIGALVGAHSSPSTRTADGRGPLPMHVGARSDGINRAAIEASQARTAYELVSALRPTWLRARGGETLRNRTGSTEGNQQPSPSAGTLDRDGGVKVFLDGALLGDLSTLRDVTASTLTGAEFIMAGEAARRWGAGLSHGVIHLTTAAE